MVAVVSLRIRQYFRLNRERSTSESVVIGPIIRDSLFAVTYERESFFFLMRVRSIICLGAASPRFISGTRLWPPASNLAVEPCFFRSETASPALFGAKYSKGLFIIGLLSHFSLRFASRISSQTLLGVRGSSVIFTPSDESASSTALMRTDGAPTGPDSPTPLVPYGVNGLFVS